MANKKTNRIKSPVAAVILLIALIAVIVGRFNPDFDRVNVPTYDDAVTSNDVVKVHVIDVGQGSSALIQCGETGILIDAGELEYGDKVVEYLKSVGIKKLDYAVISHHHSDHMGGMIEVLKAFKVDNFIMPVLNEKNTPTTRIYENLLTLLDRKNVNVIGAEYGEKYTVGGAVLTTYAPVVQNKNLNNMSVVCKVKALSTSFVFMGDAEKEELKTFDSLNPDVRCQILVMGHHGSRTSLYKRFLSNCAFKVGVISCGKDNSYGHPHEETLSYLKENGKECIRTDRDGSVVFTCNSKGYNISFN